MEDEHSEKQKLHNELLQMGFQQQKITQALKVCDQKDQAVNYILSQIDQKPQKMLNEDQEFQDQDEQDYKMIFVVRMDLKLALGKIAELVATAALRAYKQMQSFIDKDQLKEYAFFQWSESGQKKIVVKANNQQDLLKVIKQIDEKNINHVEVFELPSKLVQVKEEQKNTKPKKKAKNKQGKKLIKQQQNVSQIKKQPEGQVMLAQASKSLLNSIQNMPKQQPVFQNPVQEKQILVLAAFGPAAQSQLAPLTSHFKLL